MNYDPAAMQHEPGPFIQTLSGRRVNPFDAGTADTGAAPDAVMAALLHDAAEAYLGDLPHPLKHRSELGAQFRQAEKRLEAVIASRFELPEASAEIKPLDRALLATERRICSRVAWDWPELNGVEPLALAIEPWEPARAAREFLERYERLAAMR
jgi:hypothetical protein